MSLHYGVTLCLLFFSSAISELYFTKKLPAASLAESKPDAHAYGDVRTTHGGRARKFVGRTKSMYGI